MTSVASNDRLEMKRRAVTFYNENNVPKRLEVLLNDMFLDNPSDINGYMAEYFSSLAKPPVLAQIHMKDQLSSSGNNTLVAEVYCIVNGVEKLVCEFESFIEDKPVKEAASIQASATTSKVPVAPKAKGKSKGKDQAVAPSPAQSSPLPPEVKSAPFNFHRYRDLISNDFIPLLKGLPLVDDQQAIDKMLGEICTSLVDNFSEETRKQPAETTSEASAVEDSKSEVTEVSAAASLQTACPEESSSTAAIAAQKEAEIEQKIQDFKLEVECAALFLSALFSHTAAVLTKSQLYEYLNKALGKDEDKFKLPTPALCFFSCGLENPGKCNILSEVLLLPKLDIDLKEGIEKLLKIYKETEKVLLQKYGSSGLLLSNVGTLTPTLERPELVFEVLSQACTSLSIELKDSCDIILNTAANTIYDEDKKKYEIIQGNQRTSTELVSLYEGWVNEFPIVAIIDGLSSKDVENATLLHSQLGQKCLILNSFASADASLTSLNDKHCNGFVCDLSKNISLSNINDCVDKLEQTGLSTGLMFGGASLDFSDTTFSVDLAVALHSTFVYIGAPSGSERMNKLNRIISIYSELAQNSKYEPRTMYKFSDPPEPVVEQSEVPESE